MREKSQQSQQSTMRGNATGVTARKTQMKLMNVIYWYLVSILYHGTVVNLAGVAVLTASLKRYCSEPGKNVSPDSIN